MNRSIRNTAFTSLALVAFAATAAARETPASGLKAQAKISEQAARATALAKVPKGKIASSELEEEHGKLIWSFDINRPGTKNVTEIQVDAKNGMIVSTKVETPMKEAAEATAEAAEATAKKK